MANSDIYPKSDCIILRGQELVVGWGGQTWNIKPAVLTGLGVNMMPRRHECWDAFGNTAGVIIGPPELDLTINVHGFGVMLQSESRMATLRRMCEGLTVRELLGVIDGKLKERQGQS